MKSSALHTSLSYPDILSLQQYWFLVCVTTFYPTIAEFE